MPEGLARPPVIIVGAANQGAVVAAVLTAMRREVRGYVDDNPALHGQLAGPYPVLGPVRAEHFGGEAAAAVAISDNYLRRQVSNRLRDAGIELIKVVHPSAVVMQGVDLGTGVFIAAGAVVVTGTSIGEDAVLNTRCSVDHDSRIAPGAYLSPGVCTAGAVDVGEYAFLGVGSSVGPNVRIGNNSVIGAGATVLDDIPANAVAWGVPARVRRRQVSKHEWGRILARRVGRKSQDRYR